MITFLDDAEPHQLPVMGDILLVQAPECPPFYTLVPGTRDVWWKIYTSYSESLIPKPFAIVSGAYGSYG